jgi:hypothetical protein
MISIKKIYLSFFVVLFSGYTLADTIDQERKFTIYAKLPLVPKLSVMEIETSLNIENSKYFYEFNIKSKNIVEFINQVNGSGKVNGVITDTYKPTNYSYNYTRKKKKKYVEINYSNDVVKKIVNLPNFDKSKLSIVTEDMLIGTIDPSSFFLNLLNYNKTKQCKNKFKVFDGKRRYDVIFTSITKNKKNNSIECEANQIRLGGYKKDEKVSDVFAASDYIKVIYADNDNKDFIGYEAKNGSIKIIIEEIK